VKFQCGLYISQYVILLYPFHDFYLMLDWFYLQNRYSEEVFEALVMPYPQYVKFDSPTMALHPCIKNDPKLSWGNWWCAHSCTCPRKNSITVAISEGVFMLERFGGSQLWFWICVDPGWMGRQCAWYTGF
jgi:hypothetical protein